MKKSLVIIILFSFVFVTIYSLPVFAGETKRITKIIISGYGKNCDVALEDAKRKCSDKKGEVTFVGICSEQKDEPEDSRWKQDVYCKIKW